MKLEMTEGLYIHNEKIDTQHQVYFDLLNDIDFKANSGATKSRLISAFKEFVQFVRFHFMSEENQMLDSDYDGLKKHRAAHNYCLEGIKTKLFDYDNDAVTVQEIIDFAVEWFLMHVSAHDKEFGIFLASQQPETA